MNSRAIKKDCSTPHKANYQNQTMGVSLKKRYQFGKRESALRFSDVVTEKEFLDTYWEETLVQRRRATWLFFALSLLLYAAMLWTWISPGSRTFLTQPLTGWMMMTISLLSLVGATLLQLLPCRIHLTETVTSFCLLGLFGGGIALFNLPPGFFGYPINKDVSLEVVHTLLQSQAVAMIVGTILFYGLALPTISRYASLTLTALGLLFLAAAIHNADARGLDIFYGILILVMAVSTAIAISQRERARRRLFVQEKENRKQQIAIEKAHAESERILLNIFPESIARELKARGAVTPKYFESASVVFTDFVGFTQISEQMTPPDLINELDYCFTQFDEISRRYDVEKLKTIGDAYMCASGLPLASNTHAIDACLAALEFRSFMFQMQETKQEMDLPFWQLRIGIHSGPLTAGVIGTKKFAYDIWGDTVNIASRMESSGEPGKVNVSHATYELVKAYFDFEARGRVHAKGKGEVEMYFLLRIRPELSADSLGSLPNSQFLILRKEQNRSLRQN